MTAKPRSFLHLLSPTCREAAALVSQSMDRKLGRLERVGVVLHLAICTSCRRFSRSVHVLRQALRLGPKDWAGDAALPPEIHARIRARLEQQ
jgi:predicted anti-sigma-YlaC factor YlaD